MRANQLLSREELATRTRARVNDLLAMLDLEATLTLERGTFVAYDLRFGDTDVGHAFVFPERVILHLVTSPTIQVGRPLSITMGSWQDADRMYETVTQRLLARLKVKIPVRKSPNGRHRVMLCANTLAEHGPTWTPHAFVSEQLTTTVWRCEACNYESPFPSRRSQRPKLSEQPASI